MMPDSLNQIKVGVVLGLLLVSSFTVYGYNGKQQEMNDILRRALANLHLASGGLEYPRSKEDLDNCIKYNDKACLDVFNLVEEAKKTITSFSDSRALDYTLDIIEDTCMFTITEENDVPPDENDLPFICYGGIMSLYYYTSPDQDQKILSRIKRYPKKLKYRIFNYGFNWYHNRPDPNKWIDFISSADIHWTNEASKKITIKWFNLKIAETRFLRSWTHCSDWLKQDSTRSKKSDR